MKKKRVTNNLSSSNLSDIVKKEAKLFIKNMNGNGASSNMHSLFLNDTERSLIDSVLDSCNGNITKSADFLGISRGTLTKRIKEYNLKIK
tara:strand:- start:1676 stop:1945 length:270 start_codon:yes stop_codon:yes gene_type:complete